MKQVYTKMTVSLDGGKSWQDAERVTVIHRSNDAYDQAILVHLPNKLGVETSPNRGRAYEGFQIYNLAGGEQKTGPKTYTRAEVQTWRDDVAHAAADMIKRAKAPAWLENDIRALASKPLRQEQEVCMWEMIPPDSGKPVILYSKEEAERFKAMDGRVVRPLIYGD